MDTGRRENAGSALPDASRSEIIEALRTFDDEYRGVGRWSDWQSSGNHKYAIEHDDRLYPVKQIVSLTTGRQPRSFSGGDQANSFVRKYDFDVVRRRHKRRNHHLN